MKRKFAGLLALGLVATLAGSVPALGASTTTIYACVHKTTGAVQKISAKSTVCKSGYSKIVWNQKGSAGLRGEPGAKGDVGATGLTGPRGAAGPAGPKGDQGPIGLQGITGAVGAIGPKGDQGETGPQGATGPAGTLNAHVYLKLAPTPLLTRRAVMNDYTGYVETPALPQGTFNLQVSFAASGNVRCYFESNMLVIDEHPVLRSSDGWLLNEDVVVTGDQKVRISCSGPQGSQISNVAIKLTELDLTIHQLD